MANSDETNEFNENTDHHKGSFSISVMNPSLNPSNQENDDDDQEKEDDDDVSDIVDTFVNSLPFINEIFKWSMTETQLKWIKECQTKERFMSRTFKINNALFVLVFCPKRDTARCSLYLKLLQLPPNIHGMVIHVATKCRPLTISDSSIFDTSYACDQSFNLLKISFADFKQHRFTKTDLYNVFECDIKALKVYKTNNIKNIHPFEWKLEDFQVQYFLNCNIGELKYTLNTAENEWSLTLKWGLKQKSDDDEEKKSEKEIERVDIELRQCGNDEISARIWIYCDEIMHGRTRHQTFSKKHFYRLFDRLHKKRFFGLNYIKFYGFIELMDGELDKGIKITNEDNIEFDGDFEWKVSPKTLKVFQNSLKEEQFWSKPFVIGGCIWTVIFYPNGIRKESEKVAIKLCLLRLPSNGGEVTVRFNVKMNEFDANGFIGTFNYDKNSIYCRGITTDQFMSLESLHLLCSIEIISKDAENGANHIDPEENKYDVMGDDDSTNDFELKLNPEEFEIFYNPELTDKKYAIFRYFWLQGIHWKFVCYPNGKNDFGDSRGCTLAYLYIEEYPEYPDNITAVKCRYWIICNEGLFGCVGSSIWKNKSKKGWGKQLNHSRFVQLKDEQMNGMTFLCHIEILEWFSPQNPIPPIETNGDHESEGKMCKTCESLILENEELLEMNEQLSNLNNNMMRDLDRLLDNKQQSLIEGDLDTEKRPMINLWNDKISKALDAQKMSKQEMEKLTQQINILRETVQKSSLVAFSTDFHDDDDQQNNDDDEAILESDGEETTITASKVTDGKNEENAEVTRLSQEAQICTKCPLLISEKESLQNENDKLKLQIKTLNDNDVQLIESKEDDQNGHNSKHDEHEALLHHLLVENDRLQRELKSKEKEMEKELVEKDKTIKTLSDSYNAMIQQIMMITTKHSQIVNVNCDQKNEGSHTTKMFQ